MKRHPVYGTVRTFAAYLRDCNEHYDGPAEVCVDARGVIMFDLEHAHDPVRCVETIPGDGAKFDSVAAARRILAAWRDADDERDAVHFTPAWPVDKLGRRKRLGKNWS